MFRSEKVKAEWRILVRISLSLFFSVCPHESGEHENCTAEEENQSSHPHLGLWVCGFEFWGWGFGLSDAVFGLVGAAEQTVVACFFLSPELSPAGREASNNSG